MNYALASLTDGTVNYGNAIIEHVVMNDFVPLIGEPSVVFSSFRGPVPDAVYDCDFVLCAGATALVPEENPNLASLAMPIVMVAGCIGLAKTTRVHGRDTYNFDPSVADRCVQPIAARDPHTVKLLEYAGLDCTLVGCPTLYYQHEDVQDEGYIASSFGRNHRKQFAKKVRETSQKLGKPIRHLIHEEVEFDHVRRLFPSDVDVICYSFDAKAMLHFYSCASLTMTGRIHGALPSLAAGKDVAYYTSNPNDSRETLFDAIGFEPMPIENFDVSGACRHDHDKTERLRDSYQSWCNTIIETLEERAT